MFESIRTIWRYRRFMLSLIRGAERLASAALAAPPKNMELIHNLDSTFFHAVLHVITLHSVEDAEALLTKMHKIDETWK